MEKASIDIQREQSNVCVDEPDRVEIKGTHKWFGRWGKPRSVKVRYICNGTIEKITKVSLDERTDVLHELQQSAKVAALVVLNNTFKIFFLYWLLWRWYFYIRQYKEEQLYPIIEMGKKKVPQTGYWMNTTLIVSMRNTAKAMTRAEVEHIQAAHTSGGKG